MYGYSIINTDIIMEVWQVVCSILKELRQR